MRWWMLLLGVACATGDPIDDKTDTTDTTDTTDDTPDDTPTPTATPVDTDSDSADTDLPQPTLGDVLDHSVNSASAAYDGNILVMQTRSGGNLPGGFNGSGTGNKCIAGVPVTDRSPLDTLTRVAFESKQVQGTASIYVNVIVDLACDGSDVRIVVVEDFTETDLGSDWTRSVATSADGSWKAVGGLDPILPSHLDAGGAPLDDLIAAYPSACMVRTATGDGGMPNGIATAPFLLNLGDSRTLGANEVHVQKIEVGSWTLE